jgi:hypothetical protein
MSGAALRESFERGLDVRRLSEWGLPALDLSAEALVSKHVRPGTWNNIRRSSFR